MMIKALIPTAHMDQANATAVIIDAVAIVQRLKQSTPSTLKEYFEHPIIIRKVASLNRE